MIEIKIGDCTDRLKDLEYEETYAEITIATTEEAKQWEGWGTTLKPSFEPVCIGVKK